MAKVSLFRCVRVLSSMFGAPVAASALAPALAAPLLSASALAALAVSGCGDVNVVDPGVVPTVTGVEPAKGPSEGGTLVVVSGRDFVDGATVRFGGKLATNVEWVSDLALNAVTPPGSGVVSVSVENPGHTTDTLEAGFTYEGGASGGCVISSTVPDIGGKDVPVVGDVVLKFSAPIDAASLQGQVTVKRLGGDAVPVDVLLDAQTDSDVIVRPKQSLRFWDAYAVVVGDGVKATDGSSCSAGALAFATIEPKAAPRGLRPASVSGMALVGTKILTVSEGYRGLQTYDVFDIGKVLLESDLVTTFGPRAITVRSGRAYAASGFGGVRIFDIEDPVAPVLLGHGGTPGRANDVAVIEKNGKTFLVVADFGGGVRVLDATDTNAVADMGTLNLGGGSPSSAAVSVQGDRIAVADNAKIILIDLPDPGNLGTQKLLGSVDAGGGLSDILLDGNRVYVTKTFSGLGVWDVTDPAAPVLIENQDDPDGPCNPGCLDISYSLVKDGNELFAAFGRGGVVKYAIEANGALTPVTNYVAPSNVRQVAVDANHVFVGGDEGLVVYDRAGDGSTPAWFDPNGHGNARAVAVRGDTAYVAAALRGVQTFSLNQADAPEMIDRDDTPASLVADVAASGIAIESVEGKVLAVGDGRAGCTLFDLTDAKNPALGGTVDTTDGVGATVMVGTVAYVCNGNGGIVAVDATDPAAPKQLGEVTFSDFMGADSCGDLLPSGNLMYVARRAGIGLLDITDPTNLAWKKIVPLPSKGTVTGVKQVGTHLVATSTVSDFEGTNNTTSKLHVFDASDPESPVLVWSSSDLAGAAGLTVARDIGFVASGSDVKIFDLSDIAKPFFEGSVTVAGSPASIALGKGVVYVAQGAGGLQAVVTGPLPEEQLK